MTKVGDRKAFLRTELRATGRQVTEGAVSVLLDAVGSDLRELVSRGRPAARRHRPVRSTRRSWRATTAAAPTSPASRSPTGPSRATWPGRSS